MSTAAADVRSRILSAASAIIAAEGSDAATTRAVAAAAAVQAPTIYRLFGDKRSLLDAVVAQALTAFFNAAIRAPQPGPLRGLRASASSAFHDLERPQHTLVPVGGNDGA